MALRMALKRAYYSDSISRFLETGTEEIIGRLVTASAFDDNVEQKTAWLTQISILRKSLLSFDGRGYISFELAIPRLGRRIDVLCTIDHVVFVLEFKVGQGFHRAASDQTLDYALDLKNFHATSHDHSTSHFTQTMSTIRLMSPQKTLTKSFIELCLHVWVLQSIFTVGSKGSINPLLQS